MDFLILLFIGALIGLFYYTCARFVHMLLYKKLKLDAFLYAREFFNYQVDLDRFNETPKRMFHTESDYGYSLAGTALLPFPDQKKFVIISHGVTNQQLSSIKYAYLFMDQGFNVILYDHRRHGFSGGTTTTYGYYEKYDLKKIVDWTYAQFGENSVVGIHGESMGAATALLYAGQLEDRCDFYIADCSYSDFTELLKHQLRTTYHLPAFPIIPFTAYLWKRKTGFTLDEISPVHWVVNIKHPVLFIHSLEDTYTPPSHSRMLHQKKEEDFTLFLAPKGIHACSYVENRGAYEETLNQFLSSLLYKAKKS